MAARQPDKCLDHSTLAKHRATVVTELAAFRSRFGRVAIVEKLYADQLARYDERAKELDQVHRPHTTRAAEASS